MELDLVPSEDEIGGYIPLERPSCTNTNTDHAAARPQIVYSDEESHHEVSSDDSDDAKMMKNPRKRKISPANPPPRTDAAKKKKFNIWSDILQEDAMENQFNDSKFFGGSRGNETYNYRMKYFVNGNENEKNDSSMNDDSRNVEKFDMKNRPWAKRRKFNRKLKLSSLEVTAEDTEQRIAIDIAKKLNEPKSDLIEKIVNTLGKQKAIDLYNKTKEIEQKGGYLTLDKSRRRTSGGVFLKLVKDNKLSRKQFDAIFKYADDFNKKFNKPRKLPQEEEKEDVNIEEGEIRDEDDKYLPTRAELELSLSIEDHETNVLKNPPPSPVYPTTSLSNNTCSLSEDFFPNDYSPPRRSSSPFRNSDSASKDSTSITMNSNSTNYYSPTSPDFIPTYSVASPRRIPESPDYSPASPVYFPTSPSLPLSPDDSELITYAVENPFNR